MTLVVGGMLNPKQTTNGVTIAYIHNQISMSEICLTWGSIPYLHNPFSFKSFKPGVPFMGHRQTE